MNDDPPMYDQGAHIPKKGDRFFIIWNPESAKPPRSVFSTREQAEAVAASMASRYRQEFFVCEALVSVTAATVLKTILSTPERP